MKIEQGVLSSNEKIVSDRGIENENLFSNKELINAIIESSTVQRSLNKNFKERVETIIDTENFSSLNDSSLLKKTINSFFELSNKLSEEKMRKSLNIFVELQSQNETIKQNSHFLNQSGFVENNQWTKNWIEQIQFLKDPHGRVVLKEDCVSDYIQLKKYLK